MIFCMIEAIAWLVVGYLWCQCMRVLICWHESYELLGIYVFIDITFQLIHGLKCMSRHVHIALIYM